MFLRSKKGVSKLIVVVVALVIALAVALVIILPGVKILFSSSDQLMSIAPTRCNKALKMDEQKRDIVMFAAKEMAGEENPFYDPKLAIVNYIAYLDCRNKELLFDLHEEKNRKADTLIQACGKAAFDNYEQDLKEQMSKDPNAYGEVNTATLKDLRKMRAKVYKTMPQPTGTCIFDGKLD